MLQKLKNIISTTLPKQLGIKIRKNTEIWNWLCEHTSELQGDPSASERVYAILNEIQSNTCDNGTIKRFISISEGYGFCGRAATCICAKESVSKKVSTAKYLKTKDDIAKSNAKRCETNLAKYGVTNTAQTAHAKQKHAAVYSDKEKVEKIVTQYKATVQEKYNVDNVAKLKHIQEAKAETSLIKYGVTNPMQSQAIIQKAVASKAAKYTKHELVKRNYDYFVKMVRENFGLHVLVKKDEYIGIQTRPEFTFECIKCGHSFTKRFDYASLPRCRVCFPADISYKSKGELSLLDWVKSVYNGPVISGDRQSINPYEIDIFLPNLMIGIEYCGLYYHSELEGKKSWNYHFRKWQQAEQKGITLFTIYEDEWLNKQDILKDLIASKIGVQDNKIYARKCIVSELQNDIATEFINKKHLIGAPTKIGHALGLIYDNNVVACMTFVKNNQDTWTLSRFCTQGIIVGGASKLLNYFVQNFNPKNIISFSDNRYSNGRLYQTLGFDLDGIVPPMQQYVESYLKRHDKRTLSKNKVKKLFPEVSTDGTEWEILKSLKFDRIWDCGKKKWILKL